MATHRRERIAFYAVLTVFLAQVLNAGFPRGQAFAGHSGLRATRRALPKVLRRQGPEMDGEVIPFGKHNGETYEYVLDTDPDYCAFVMGATDPSPAMEQFQDFLEAKGFKCPPLEETVISFGKHRGETFASVLSSDPDYCDFALSLADPIPSMLKFQDFCKEHYTPEAQDTSIIGFGKYKGEKTFAEVMRMDPDYCEFILGLSDVTAGSMIKFQRYLSENFDAPGPDEQIVSFGKYKGETYSTVLSIDPEYCEYVMTLEDAGSSMQRFQAFIREKLGGDSDSPVEEDEDIEESYAEEEEELEQTVPVPPAPKKFRSSAKEDFPEEEHAVSKPGRVAMSERRTTSERRPLKLKKFASRVRQ